MNEFSSDRDRAVLSVSFVSNRIEQAAQAAAQAAKQHVLSDYLETKSPETLRRQAADIALFEAYLADAGAPLSAMASDLSQWKAINFALIAGFKRWMLKEGYAVGSVNVRLATIKTYCALAAQAGYITAGELALIRTVRGVKQTEGRNIDEKRKHARVGRKKAQAVSIAPPRVKLLKRQLLADDSHIARRDMLLLCFLTDHGLRCGEIAQLEANCIDLDAGTFTFYRHKVHKTQTHFLSPDTLAAAIRYFEVLTPSDKLFEGIHRGERVREDGTHTQGKTPEDGLSRNAINVRVKQLGKLVGIKNLSPHDLRHYWATDASRNETDVAVLKQAGGWNSAYMPLRYIEDSEIANKGVKLS
jgi:integrase